MHDLAEVKAVLAAAVERHPNRRNPVKSLSCLNTGRNGSHCIAAQVVCDLGYAMTEWGCEANEGPIEETLEELGIFHKFTGGAINYLSIAQGIFDSTHAADRDVLSPNKGRRKWSTCYRELKRRGGRLNVSED